MTLYVVNATSTLLRTLLRISITVENRGIILHFIYFKEIKLFTARTCLHEITRNKFIVLKLLKCDYFTEHLLWRELYNFNKSLLIIIIWSLLYKVKVNQMTSSPATHVCEYTRILTSLQMRMYLTTISHF